MKDKKKVWNIVQVLFFLIILGAGAGALIFGVCEGKTYSDLEKRELKEFPKVEAASIFNGNFESGFNDALSDHIYGRDVFVTVKTLAQIALGAREIDKVYIAGDRLIETYRDDDFDDKQIEENVSELAGFMASASRGLGTDHVKLMLVPSKCSVYRNDLPGYLPLSNRSDSLASEVRLKLAEKLTEAKSQGNVEAKENNASDTDESDEDGSEDGFDFGDGDPSEEGEDEVSDAGDDEEGFDFDDGDPSEEGDDEASDAEDEGDEEGFDFDEGDPSKEDDSDVEDDSDDDGDEDGADADKEAENIGGADGNNALEQIDPKTAADSMVIDLRPVFNDHLDEYIYYMTDHHWTTLGAGYAYQKFTNNSTDNQKETVAEDFLGTDYNRIHFYKKYDSIDRIIIPEADGASVEINDSGETRKAEGLYDKESLNTADKYNYFLSGNYSEITINTNVNNDRSLLLVKDSFSNSLVPYLCKEYSKIFMVDLRYVNASIYDYIPEGENPTDVLVVYNEEKFMQDTHQMYLK